MIFRKQKMPGREGPGKFEGPNKWAMYHGVMRDERRKRNLGLTISGGERSSVTPDTLVQPTRTISTDG
jgi:hypothetical protein